LFFLIRQIKKNTQE